MLSLIHDRGRKSRTRQLRQLWLLLCLTVVAGCNSAPAPTDTEEAERQSNARTTQDACRARLDGAISRLRPDRVASIGRTSDDVGALNAWLVECASADLQNMSASPENLSFLGETAQRAVTSPRFTARDAAYVRDSLVSARLAQAIIGREQKAGEQTDVDRVVNVFRWVGANISLEGPDEPGIAKTYLDVLLTGRGKMEARIWVFGVLMRQLQRDAVLLRTGDDSGDSESLIAVSVDGGMLLFDPVSWFPVPASGDESVQVDHPAGLESLTDNDKWSNVTALIIAETSAVCPRMLILQEQLPAQASAVLYEEIAGGTSDIRPLVERVVSAAPNVLDASRIAWWSWPNEQVAAATGADEEQRRKYAEIMRPFEAPFERQELELGTDFQEILSRNDISQEQRDSVWAARWQMEYKKMQELQASGDSEKLFGRASSGLLKTRLSQVEGNSDRGIIQQLQKIRNACFDDEIRMRVPQSVDLSGVRSIPIPEAIQEVNLSATGSALYWTAICQIDRGQPGTAITTLAGYRRQNPDGMWFYPSLHNQAKSELAQGRTDAAIATLTEADSEKNPDRQHAVALLHRLKKPPASADEEETPAEPDSSSDTSDAAESSEASEPDAEPASQEPTESESSEATETQAETGQ
jgi:hypothetical protein